MPFVPHSQRMPLIPVAEEGPLDFHQPIPLRDFQGARIKTVQRAKVFSKRTALKITQGRNPSLFNRNSENQIRGGREGAEPGGPKPERTNQAAISTSGIRGASPCETASLCAAWREPGRRGPQNECVHFPVPTIIVI